MVAAAVVLVTGLVGGSVAFIQIAIALALVSMVLVWAARWIGSTPAPAGSTEPAPLPVSRSDHLTIEPAAGDVRVTSGRHHHPEVRSWLGDSDDGDAGADVPGEVLTLRSVDHAVDEGVDDGGVDAVADDRVADDPVAAFPIADYDHLWSTQIIPLLAELDVDELAMVEARERGGRHRSGVIDAVRDERRLRELGVSFADVGTDLDGPDDRAGGPDSPAHGPDSSDVIRPRTVDLRALPEVPDDSADPEVRPSAEADAGEVVDVDEPGGPEDSDEGGSGGGPRVRTFLGRRRSPLTIHVG